MEQLTQKLKDGEMQVIDVPLPLVSAGMVLVRNHYSLISAGTEGSTVKAARAGLLNKAKERPQQVKQVIDVIKSQGLTQAYRAVMKKLEAYSPLGYSCAGEVIAVAADVAEFSVGDLVACGGLTASHTEVVSVPVNLCVRLPRDADLKQAAYNTLGAIALQGVRQADLRLGECCAVIGLGLLGQLAALMLRASGVKVIGIDIDSRIVEIAALHCADLSLHRGCPGIEDRIMTFTDGLGCDAVVITAATNSLDPINFAGAVARKRGTVVIVGSVPAGFDRDPHFYRKELQIKMSCSYGPGRYDPAYEEKGLDYPPAYVRWTEKRNMKAFQDLLSRKKIDVSYLTTHVLPLEKAPEAYDLLLSHAEPFIGILIEYDHHKPFNSGRIPAKSVSGGAETPAVAIGFIGAGSYAMSHLLPNIPHDGRVKLKGVITAGGTTARNVADRFGFEFCTDRISDILDNDEINTVFIATRHDVHAKMVIEALRAGKHVFVEKPLCLNESQLFEIKNVYQSFQDVPPRLIAGFNRRFSPSSAEIKESIGGGPAAMLYRINSGAVPADSWIQDPDMGGRIIGEVCHFIDYLTYISGSLPVSVYACAMAKPDHLHDVLTLSLNYANGSIGTISYFANGDRSVSKERIEIFSSGCTSVIDDFKTFTIHAGGKKSVKKLLSQDKGQKHLVHRFIQSIRDGSPAPIPFAEIYHTTLVTFKVIESLRSGACIRINP